jgi:hypothetical protein
MSSLIIFQHYEKNRPTNPSRPGAFSLGARNNTFLTSSYVKGTSKCCKSLCCHPKLLKWETFSGYVCTYVLQVVIKNHILFFFLPHHHRIFSLQGMYEIPLFSDVGHDLNFFMLASPF